MMSLLFQEISHWINPHGTPCTAVHVNMTHRLRLFNRAAEDN